MTRPPARTTTRAPVGSMVIGWSGPGTSTFFSVITETNVRRDEVIPDRRTPSVRGRVELRLVGRDLRPAGRAPLPVADLRQVLSVRPDVDAVLDQLVLQGLPGPAGRALEAVDPVDDVHGEVEAVDLVEDRHVEGRRGGALLLVATDVEVAVVGPLVGEPVDQPRVAVVGEDHRT